MIERIEGSTNNYMDQSRRQEQNPAEKEEGHRGKRAAAGAPPTET